MNMEVLFFLGMVCLIAILIVLNLLIWIRPELIIKSMRVDLVLFHSSVATMLAIALFLSCFMVGVWLSILKLQGRLGVYL